jgi:hypothetical protein
MPLWLFGSTRAVEFWSVKVSMAGANLGNNAKPRAQSATNILAGQEVFIVRCFDYVRFFTGFR